MEQALKYQGLERTSNKTFRLWKQAQEHNEVSGVEDAGRVKISHFWPMEGRRHDWTLYIRTGLEEALQDLFLSIESST